MIIKNPIRLRLLVCVILMAASCNLAAQHSVGLEFNVNKDVFTLQDEGGEVAERPRINISPVICYRYHFIKQNIVLSGGLAFKTYDKQIAFKRNTGGFSSNGKIVALVPLSIGKRLQIAKNTRFALTPFMGLTYGYVLIDGVNSTSMGRISYKGDTLRYSYFESTRRHAFLLLSPGLAAEFKIISHFSAAISVSGNFGFVPLIEDRMDYSYNSKPSTALYSSKGTFWTLFSCRLYYHFFKKLKKS